jgi:hypothetical protein
MIAIQTTFAGLIEKKSNCFFFGPNVTLEILFDTFDFLFAKLGLLLQKSIMVYRYTFHNKIQSP